MPSLTLPYCSSVPFLSCHQFSGAEPSTYLCFSFSRSWGCFSASSSPDWTTKAPSASPHRTSFPALLPALLPSLLWRLSRALKLYLYSGAQELHAIFKVRPHQYKNIVEESPLLTASPCCVLCTLKNSLCPWLPRHTAVSSTFTSLSAKLLSSSIQHFPLNFMVLLNSQYYGLSRSLCKASPGSQKLSFLVEYDLQKWGCALVLHPDHWWKCWTGLASDLSLGEYHWWWFLASTHWASSPFCISWTCLSHRWTISLDRGQEGRCYWNPEIQKDHVHHLLFLHHAGDLIIGGG